MNSTHNALMNRKKLILIALGIACLIIISLYNQHTLLRLYKGARTHFSDSSRAKLYSLPKGQTIHNITDKLLRDKSIPETLKIELRNNQREIWIFKYPSNGVYVAGYASLLKDPSHPSLVFLRGGNGNFGIMRPNNPFSFIDGFNVIGTLYRGNIYKGQDEFGGADLQDTENLVKFLPQLERASKHKIETPHAMIGVSRGGMQLFATLAHSSYMRERIDKAITVSGNVALEVTAAKRPEMKYMFMRKYQQQDRFKDFNSWIKHRDPVSTASLLNPKLSVLMIYGLADERVPIEEQHAFQNALNNRKIRNQLITIPNAKHGMDGHMNEVKQHIKTFLG